MLVKAGLILKGGPNQPCKKYIPGLVVTYGKYFKAINCMYKFLQFEGISDLAGINFSDFNNHS